MQYKTNLAVLLLSVAMFAVPGVTGVAYAHGDWQASDSSAHGEHQPMSKDKIALVRATFKKVHEENKAVFEEMHKLWQQKHAILAAKTFDKQAFLEVSASLEQKKSQLARSQAQAFASIASKFTPEERKHLGHWMGHPHHHGGWGHGDHKEWQHQAGQKDKTGDMMQAAPETPATPAEGGAPVSAQ